jgi:hypothetical protein
MLPNLLKGTHLKYNRIYLKRLWLTIIQDKRVIYDKQIYPTIMEP